MLFDASMVARNTPEGGRVISELDGLCMTVPEQHLTGSGKCFRFCSNHLELVNDFLDRDESAPWYVACASRFSCFPNRSMHIYQQQSFNQSIKPFESMRKCYPISDLFQYQCVLSLTCRSSKFLLIPTNQPPGFGISNRAKLGPSNHGQPRSNVTMKMLSFKHHANHEQMALWLWISNLATIFLRGDTWEMARKCSEECVEALVYEQRNPPFHFEISWLSETTACERNVQARDSCSPYFAVEKLPWSSIISMNLNTSRRTLYICGYW